MKTSDILVALTFSVFVSCAFGNNGKSQGKGCAVGLDGVPPGQSGCPGTKDEPCACPEHFERAAGRCYHRASSFGAVGADYQFAVAYCNLLGAIIFTPRTQEENQWVIGTESFAWLGYRRDNNTDPFVGEDGLGGLTYTNWISASSVPLFDCVRFDFADGIWFSTSCTAINRVICQLRDCYRPECPDAEQPDE